MNTKRSRLWRRTKRGIVGTVGLVLILLLARWARARPVLVLTGSAALGVLGG
jgi:hypothetical protein